MIELVTSITERVITIGDIVAVSSIAIGLICGIGLLYFIGSIIMKGWEH